jgi:hypothetical protein
MAVLVGGCPVRVSARATLPRSRAHPTSPPANAEPAEAISVVRAAPRRNSRRLRRFSDLLSGFPEPSLLSIFLTLMQNVIWCVT